MTAARQPLTAVGQLRTDQIRGVGCPVVCLPEDSADAYPMPATPAAAWNSLPVPGARRVCDPVAHGPVGQASRCSHTRGSRRRRSSPTPPPAAAGPATAPGSTAAKQTTDRGPHQGLDLPRKHRAPTAAKLVGTHAGRMSSPSPNPTSHARLPASRQRTASTRPVERSDEAHRRADGPRPHQRQRQPRRGRLTRSAPT